MKVFLITEGSRKIGFGHISRCTALYNAFLDFNIEAHFIINGDNSIIESLKDKNYTLLNWIEKIDILISLITKDDIVVIDSYLAELKDYVAISEVAKLSFYIDDIKRIKYPKGIIINPSIYARDFVYTKYYNTDHILGAKYCLLRKEFINVHKDEISDEIHEILITLGGQDIRNLTPKLIKYIRSGFPEKKLLVIVGNGFENIEEIQELQDDKIQLIFNANAEKMVECMIKSDIAISGAGQTLSELACIGVPTIAISIAENQYKNAVTFKEYGVIFFAGNWNNDKILENVKRGIIELENKQKRKMLVESGLKLINPKGNSLIIKKIIELSEKL